MNSSTFKTSLWTLSTVFVLVFFIILLPSFINRPDIINAVKGGFVNPYSTLYSLDAIFCWIVLFTWIVYEWGKVKYAWLCLLLGIFPGVALGFALYLIIRIDDRSTHG